MQVANVDEAIALATEFKQSGRYDWFRGQARNFPVVASFHRLSQAEGKAALELGERFNAWVNATPGLEGLAAQGVDAVIAVAQHHGIPTPFVDFTTEPETAGFFASDAADLAAGELSCIICLDTDGFVEFWQDMANGDSAPECLRVDVSNLWRLQAQHGVFLFNPYEDIERLYGFDRILFPAGARADDEARARIYPRRKSQLEILLDQYFMNEWLAERHREFAEVRSLMHVIQASAPVDGVNPELTARAGVPVLKDWSERKLTAWRSTHDERLADAKTDRTIELQIDARGDGDLARHVAAQVDQALVREPGLRQQLVTWKPVDAELRLDGLQTALDWLWDGLRTLPYDHIDIAAAIGNCVALYRVHESADPAVRARPWQRAANAVLGKAIEVELAGPDGSYSRAYASAADLLGCVRDDIDEHLAPAYRSQIAGSIFGVLQAVQAPARLYEFDRITPLFARQIAPTQVLMRSGQAVYFSVARIERMGLP